MIYPRRIYPQLVEHLQAPQVTVITGMRRTGKTVLLTSLFESLETRNKVFIDLESRINREIFLTPDYEEIWINLQKKYSLNSTEKVYLFIDEIQYLSGLPSVMKYLFDHYQVKFIVTGSSSFYLKNLFSESLSGRKQIFELFPLTFDEFLLFKGKLPKLEEGWFDLSRIKKSDFWQRSYEAYFEEYLKFGAFPAVILEESVEKKIILLKDILYSYIDADVKNISHFKRIADMERLIRLLPARIGQKLDLSKLSREISLSRSTIGEYLGFLEKTYFIFFIPSYSRSADRQVSKAPKIYFCDTGLANVLSQISNGQALENAVYHALRVKYQPTFAFSGISYYQRRSGREIDFILGDEVALEVKETADVSDFVKLRRYTERLGIKNFYLTSKNISKAPSTIYVSQI